MSIRRGRVPSVTLSFAASAVILALCVFAQAPSLGVEPISRTRSEALLVLAGGQEPSGSWNTSEEVVSESGPVAGKASKSTVRGSRAGKAFTTVGKKEIDAANAAKNDGVNKCENCGTDVVPGQKSQRGVSPPTNQRERDHIVPKSKGGDGTPSNGQVLCRECNLEKSDKKP
jgi:hypothetical protein